MNKENKEEKEENLSERQDDGPTPSSGKDKEYQIEHQPEPQPPLYTCTTRCYTCGKIISHIWMLYGQELKKLTGGDPTNIPIRTINTQKLMSNDSKTEEGKILDRKGVIRYCCRRMILSEPMNTTAIID